MRIPLVLALVLGSLAACSSSPRAVSPADVEAATKIIGTTLDDWHDSAAHAHEARYLEHFAPGCVFLGTDATERWDCDAFKSYVHAAFAKGKGWAFHAARRHVTLAPGGQLAWFDEALETQNLGPARGSGVLVQAEPGQWKIAQYNLALTVPNDRLDEVKKLLGEPRDAR